MATRHISKTEVIGIYVLSLQSTLAYLYVNGCNVTVLPKLLGEGIFFPLIMMILGSNCHLETFYIKKFLISVNKLELQFLLI